LFKCWLRSFCVAALILLVRVGRFVLAPVKGGPTCRFIPSCSEYAVLAIQEHGPIKGLCLAVRRLLKCHPLHPGGLDPVPRAKSR